jgi:predicted AlkP superfamily phosphohydrolase/phosphomutase
MPPRVMIFGLDGATFHFIRPLAMAGRLPALADLMARGTSGELRSIYPPHTAAAWSTFMTGELPGNHGVFNFYELNLTRYSRRGRPVTSDALRGRTIFDVASAHGLRVAALHVPMTFPAWPINGVMFSGYPAPAGSPACAYPRTLAATFGRLTGITWTRSPDKRVRWSQEHIALQTDLCEQVLTQEAPDLFMTVYQETDWAHHYLWRYHDPRSPAYTAADARRYGDHIALVYQALDQAIGRLLCYAGPETTIFVVSDHGGTVSAPNAFHLNAWLASQGLFVARTEHATWLSMAFTRQLTRKLRTFPLRELKEQRFARWLLPIINPVLHLARRAGLESLMDHIYQVHDSGASLDPTQTRAYRFQVVTQAEGIALNVAGRQPQGIVQPGAEYETLRDQIIAGLQALRTPDTDEPLMIGVYRREEIFAGRHMEEVPDIIVRLHPLYRVGTNVQPPLFTQLRAADVQGPLSGWHDDYGILIAAGPGIAAGVTVTGASLLNMAPTILHALGLSAPPWMEGTVQEGLFASKAIPVARGSGQWTTNLPDSELGSSSEDLKYEISADEEQLIEERLRNLGYL